MSKEPRRYYSNATIAALMTLARGGCYAPDCGVPTVRMVDGLPMLNLEIAHIRAFEEGGKRFAPDWSVKDRNSFANLLLLCNGHHKLVDGPNSEDYPVELLEEWKATREAEGLDALEGLSNLTEDKLAEMLSTAQSDFLNQLEPALDEFSKTFPELAELLTILVDELADPRVHGFGIPEDVVRMLHSSAHQLRHLEDSASRLSNAADQLSHLQDSAYTLLNAADYLRGLDRTVAKLETAADRLSDVPDSARMLTNAASAAKSAASSLQDARYR